MENRKMTMKQEFDSSFCQWMEKVKYTLHDNNLLSYLIKYFFWDKALYKPGWQ